VRIHVGRPELVPELVRYFESQCDCVVQQVGDLEVEVALLGSYRHDRHDAAVERLMAAYWTQANAGPAQARSANGNGKEGGRNGKHNRNGRTSQRPDSA